MGLSELGLGICPRRLNDSGSLNRVYWVAMEPNPLAVVWTRIASPFLTSYA